MLLLNIASFFWKIVDVNQTALIRRGLLSESSFPKPITAHIPPFLKLSEQLEMRKNPFIVKWRLVSFFQTIIELERRPSNSSTENIIKRLEIVFVDFEMSVLYFGLL